MPARIKHAGHAIAAKARLHPKAAAATCVTGAAALALVASAVIPAVAGASTKAALSCTTTPSTCGFPDATNSGVPKTITLKTVPGQVSSGPGWFYNTATQQVNVTGTGAVLTGLSIPYTVNVTAANVTLNDDLISVASFFGVSLRHAPGATIENSTIRGTNGTTGEVGSAIIDVYSDSTGLIVKNNDISWCKTAVQVTTGLITANYIHDPGFVTGDHTNGVFDVGTTQPLTISNNTILDPLGQTDAISLDATLDSQTIANKTITGNLLGGGSYAIYGGNTRNAVVTNMVITGNTFSQAYYAKSGQFGPVAYFNSTAPGSSWSSNTWDTTGAAIPAP
jgi:hypothetical protein